MIRPADNPPSTFPAGAGVGDFEGTWWVAHTRPRQEKAFAHDLCANRMSYFLPMVEKVRLAGGRKLRPLLPLFPSYVFVCGTDEERRKILKGGRVAGTLRVARQEKLLDELAQIQRALEAEAPLEPFPFLKRGRRCRVSSGPFEGMEGVVSRRRGAGRLVIAVETLGQSVALEVEAGLMEPVD